MLCSVGTGHCCISAVKVCQVKPQKCQLAAEEVQQAVQNGNTEERKPL